ncbi:MAG: hypothetical protein NTU41_14620, partial [Chloroflexi bacterium]|nr:hypothetical protein [Chloroflexota bacterium]
TLRPVELDDGDAVAHAETNVPIVRHVFLLRVQPACRWRILLYSRRHSQAPGPVPNPRIE